MSMLRNVLTYMGLGPDEDYEDGYLYEADQPGGEVADRRVARRPRERPSGGYRDSGPHDDRPARRPPPVPARAERREPDPGPPVEAGERRSVRPLRAVPEAVPGPPDDGVTVRPVPPPGPVGGLAAAPRPLAKPRPLSPRSFGDAKILADEFKRSVPVIMNLQGVDRDLARRLIDFASGVCYALDGSMEKIASQVFLLTPQAVEVAPEDRRRFDR